MSSTQNVLAITEIVIQLENQVQPCRFKAPVVVKGLNIVVDDKSTVVYEPAEMIRPMASLDFNDEIIQAINHQLSKVGLHISKTKE